ncbi:MAG: DNA polymerase III subunit beta [Lachnospiraceae bacterium]|jgi:DNA polymerase-3 subunit beta|nr:DNA polymerase III subunit beta [Lachnospiraceae bacterium]
MRISCNKEELQRGVNIVSKAVSKKTSMKILECILIDASSDKIKLTGNDMELGIKTIIEGDIEDTGSIALDAKFLGDIIRTLPANSEITIDSDKNYTTYITCENSQFKLSGLPSDEFTNLPVIEKDKYIEISSLTLKEMIRQTIFSISTLDNNKIMTGELLEINNDVIRLVSLDGHRISIRNTNINSSEINKKLIIPGKTLNEISKILSGDTEEIISIYFDNNHVIFEFEDTLVVSRLIEGEYFNIDQMLSNDYETKLVINKRQFMNSIDRSMIYLTESDKKPLILSINDTEMDLMMRTTKGEFKENIEVNKEGKDILIGFNPKFLKDALSVIDDEDITIYMMNAKAPCFIKDENTYTYLILPVNFNVNSF